MSRETVLSLLLAHPGEYLSGAAMSRTLGVSRAAVWKAIEALRQEGYEITSAPNRAPGYGGRAGGPGGAGGGADRRPGPAGPLLPVPPGLRAVSDRPSPPPAPPHRGGGLHCLGGSGCMRRHPGRLRRPPQDQVDQRHRAGREKAVRYSHRDGAGERDQRPPVSGHRHWRECQPAPRGLQPRRAAHRSLPLQCPGPPGAPLRAGGPDHPGSGPDVLSLSPGQG